MDWDIWSTVVCVIIWLSLSIMYAFMENWIAVILAVTLAVIVLIKDAHIRMLRTYLPWNQRK